MDYAGLTAKLLTNSAGTEDSDPLMNRMEDKYLVSRSFLEKLTSTLRENLKDGESDTHVRFNYSNTIYLDTKDLDCFRDAAAGIKPRFKVRIRHYAPNGGKFEDVAYLELKIKTPENLTKKTRIRIPAHMIPGIAHGTFTLTSTEELVNLNRDITPQVLLNRLQTINSTLQKYGFRQQIVTAYERRAYANDQIRVTVDDHIEYFDATQLGDARELIEDVPGFKRMEKLADRVRNTPYVVLEVKHRGIVPEWLKKLMKEVEAERAKFSKYATAIVNFSKDGAPSGTISKQGLDVQPLMALFHEPVAKGKKSKDLANIAYVVLRDRNFVLVGKRNNNDKWGLPGGRFEDGEDKEEVALRELKEETGIKLKRGDLTYEGKRIVETDTEIKTVYIFSGKHPGGEPKTKDGEFASWEWMRCENGMLPEKILEEKMNGPTEAAFEAMGLSKAMSKKTLYYVAVVPINSQGQVLLGERKEDGIWTTPAGGADAGESPEQVAIRECWEEAGLAVLPSMLEPLCVKAAPNGKPVHCYLVRTNQTSFTLKMDPDKEVHSWEWYSRENLPAGLSRQKNQNRLETITQALMHFYGLRKNMEDAKIISLVDKLKKGGPGSGQVGHVTAKQPSHLHPQVHSDPVKPVNKLQTHLMALEHGGVIPGVSTQSGKPVVTNMDQAKAHSYGVQDHVDAMNAHFELAQKTQAMMDKLKMAGHKVPAEGAKIAQFHQKKMKEHMKARQYLEERKKHTAEAIKEKKDTAIASVKKSVTQMGSGLGDRDLDVGAFAQANGHGHAEWMEKLYNQMEGYSYGDDPRELQTPKGVLHLTKVDDGIYSGYFTKMEEGLEDNAKIRIERITIPELVQLMIAKEWISNHKIEEVKSEEPIAPPVQDPIFALNQTLIAPPSPVVATPTLDQKIQFLSLIDKLLS